MLRESIKIVSVLLFSLFIYYQFLPKDKATEVLLEEMDRSMKTSLLMQQDEMYDLHLKAKKRLSEETMKEYRFMLTVISIVEEISNDLVNYINEVRIEMDNNSVSKNTLIGIEERVENAQSLLMYRYAEVLHNNYKIFGLKESEIQNRLDVFRAELPIYEQGWLQKLEESKLSYALQIIELDARNTELKLLNELALLFWGCDRIAFDSFFPIVMPTSGVVKKGDFFEAKIAIGSYTSDVDSKDIEIIINGVPLKVNSDGTALYKAKATNSGRQVIELSSSVKNHLTGKVLTSSNFYHYEVID